MKEMFVLLSIMGLTTFATADVIHVPSEYSTIQDGINAASDGDTVLVAQGTYIGSGNRDIDFLGKAITVKSENGPSETIIDCQANAGDPHRGFDFSSGESSSSILEGFTIRNGYVTGSGFSAFGAGISCSNSSPIIADCIITENTADGGGGGISCTENSAPLITNNTIIGNTAYGDGGGIHFKDSHLTITNNTINLNSASHGGGIYAYYSGATVTDNIISENIASSWGGGLAVLEATHAPDPIWQICNNLIANNSGGSDGGGLSIQCSFPAPGHNMMNNTITGNTAVSGGAIALWLSAYPVITNSILWSNSAPEIYISSGGGEPTVSYTDIAGGWAGTGNIDTDPLFTTDYHLLAGSPCIDTGDPASPLDPDGTRADMGAFYYNQATGMTGSAGLVPIFELYPVYPNPSNSVVNVSYNLSHGEDVRIIIYDIAGHDVLTLTDRSSTSGVHSVSWDGRNNAGQKVESGIYFFRCEVDGFSQTQRMIIL